MPSTSHEVLVRLFRRCGEVAPELLRVCTDLHVEHDRVEVTSIDFSQVASTEYRADAVIELRDRDNTTVAAVVVEVQLGTDPDKPYTWPLYLAALRAEQRCPVTLLVFTEDPAVARWASKPIQLGHPGLCLRPIVIALDAVPRIIDREYALKLPELAVLSAMAHRDLDVAETAVEAISSLPEDVNRLYFDLIVSRLPDSVRRLLEARMEGYQYQSEFARRYYGQGHDEGLKKGLDEGLKKGLDEGLKKGLDEGLKKGLDEGLKKGLQQGLQDAVLALARLRLDEITPDDQAAIAARQDPQALTDLIGALARAPTPADARAAFQLVIGRP